MLVDGVDRLGKGDQMVAPEDAVGEIEDADLPQPGLALVDHEMSPERVGRVQLDLGPMRQDLGPVLARRARHRRAHQPEVGRAVVGGDEEPVAVVAHRVLDAGAARLDGPERLVRPVGAGETHLGRRVAGDLEQQERAAPRAGHVHEERLVGLEMDQHVVGGIVAQPVAVQAAGPAGVVQHDVEQRPAVVGPGHAGRDVGHRLGQEGAGRQVLDHQRERLGAAGIHRVGQQAMIGADLERAEPEVGMALGQRIQVEEDLLGGGVRLGPIRRPAAVDGILGAFGGAMVVEPAVDALGHREVGLLDPPPHLGEQPVLQGDGRTHDRVGVPVFGLEVGEDLRVFPIPQPEILVRPGVAVNGARARNGPRDGRLGDRRRARLPVPRRRGDQRGDRRVERGTAAFGWAWSTSGSFNFTGGRTGTRAELRPLKTAKSRVC